MCTVQGNNMVFLKNMGSTAIGTPEAISTSCQRVERQPRLAGGSAQGDSRGVGPLTQRLPMPFPQTCLSCLARRRQAGTACTGGPA